MSTSDDGSSKIWECNYEENRRITKKEGSTIISSALVPSWYLVSTLIQCATSPIQSGKILFSEPSCLLVVTGAQDSYLRLWDGESKLELGLLGDRKVQQSSVDTIVTDGTSHIFSGDAEGCIVIWMSSSRDTHGS